MGRRERECKRLGGCLTRARETGRLPAAARRIASSAVVRYSRRAVLVSLFLLVAVASLLVQVGLYLAWSRSRRASAVCDVDPEDALPTAVLAAAFLLEWLASIGVVLLSAAAVLTPRRRGDPAADVRVVVLHGFAQSRGAVALLARRLESAGVAVISFSYPSLRADVPAAAESLRRLLADLQRERPGPVHLVGFGIGGLVARYCVRRHRVVGVRRLITVGTPHQGTLLAPPYPATLACLRPASALLTQLAAADRAPEQFEATAIQSEFDATILPPQNAYYPAAFNVTVRDTGHFTLLFSRRILGLVLENLELS